MQEIGYLSGCEEQNGQTLPARDALRMEKLQKRAGFAWLCGGGNSQTCISM